MVYPIIDLHEDLLLADRDTTRGIHSQSNVELIHKSPVKVVLATGFADVEDPHDRSANALIAKDLDDYMRLVDRDPRWKLIRSAHELKEVLKGYDTRGIIFHIEGANAIESRNDLALLDKLYTRGLRSIGIVWMVSNALGGGTNDPKQGLTPLGREVLTWCEEKSVAVDLAHMNRQTFWDALKVIQKPPLITHTAAASLYETPRNLTDEQLLAIRDRDGVAGVFVARGSIVGKDNSNPFTIEHVIEHLEHIRHVAGDDHVALGTDLGGILSGVPAELSSIASLPTLTSKLVEHGWSKEQCEKFCFKNAERVLTAHLSE